MNILDTMAISKTPVPAAANRDTEGISADCFQPGPSIQSLSPMLAESAQPAIFNSSNDECIQEVIVSSNSPCADNALIFSASLSTEKHDRLLRMCMNF